MNLFNYVFSQLVAALCLHASSYYLIPIYIDKQGLIVIPIQKIKRNLSLIISRQLTTFIM